MACNVLRLFVLGKVSFNVDDALTLRTTSVNGCREGAFGSSCGLRQDIQSSEIDCHRSGEIQCPRCHEVTHHFVTQVLPKAASVQTVVAALLGNHLVSMAGG